VRLFHNETNGADEADVWRRAMVAQRFGRTVIDRIAKQHALCFFFEGAAARFRVTSRDAELSRDLVTACCSVWEERQCHSLM
jgi:hypothetical protein